MKKKRITMSVIGMQEGEPTFQLICQAYLTQTAGGLKLHWDQPLEGEEGHDAVTLSLSEDSLMMQRHGQMEMTLVFRPKTRYEGFLSTPAGIMDVAVFPTYIHTDAQAEHGHISLRYQLELDRQLTGIHSLEVKYIADNHAAGRAQA